MGPDHLGAPQELEHAVRKRGRPRAAAGEREDDEAVLALDLRLMRLEPITGLRVGMRKRRVDRAARAAAEQQQGSSEAQRAK